jgi:hypothetical protein
MGKIKRRKDQKTERSKDGKIKKMGRLKYGKMLKIKRWEDQKTEKSKDGKKKRPTFGVFLLRIELLENRAEVLRRHVLLHLRKEGRQAGRQEERQEGEGRKESEGMKEVEGREAGS